MTTTISSSTSTAPITTQGIGSGLDIASLVDKLMTLEAAPLTRLQNTETSVQTKVSAYGSVSSALGTFQTTVATLADPKAFQSFAASISDSTIGTVAVDTAHAGSLSAGSHTLKVTNLAASQRTASSAFTNTTDTVGSGSITIDIGSWDSAGTTFASNGTVGSKTITIDSSNNSLTGVRDAINAAGAGVTASIVNDGAGNRLVIASSTTGAANGFRIGTTDSDGGNLDATGLSSIAFDPSAAGGTPQTQRLASAANANFSIDGLAISKPTNTVSDAIAGLTLTLNKVDATGTSFAISRDTSKATAAVNNFVSAYNTIVSGMATLTSYDTTSKTAGALNGDSSMRMISSRLQSMVAAVIPTGGSLTSLNDLGIKFGSDGKLTLDATKLSTALTSDPDAVGKLFAKTGQTTDSLVGYTDSTGKTVVGSHPLTVTQLATRGGLTGSGTAGLSIVAGSNDTLEVTLDNVTSTVTVPPGNYADASALAAAVQSAINGSTDFSKAGSSVVVSASGGTLAMTSQRYGSASNVAVAGNAAAGVFGASAVPTTGVDVAGTLDGVPFVGTGQTAIGATATDAEGLKVTISGGALGARGNVALTRGIAANINDLVTQFLDPTNGILTTATAGLNKTITDLKAQEAAWTPRLDAIRARYTAQYNAMDSLVASLNSTGSYLTQQLAAIAAQRDGTNT